MKKIALVLLFVMGLGMVGAGLYSALANLDTAQDVATGYALDDTYPCGMSNLVIDPCTHCAMF